MYVGVADAWQLIWKKLEANYSEGQFELAGSWCQLSLLPVFKNCGPNNTSKLERSGAPILCCGFADSPKEASSVCSLKKRPRERSSRCQQVVSTELEGPDDGLPRLQSRHTHRESRTRDQMSGHGWLHARSCRLPRGLHRRVSKGRRHILRHHRAQEASGELRVQAAQSDPSPGLVSLYHSTSSVTGGYGGCGETPHCPRFV